MLLSAFGLIVLIVLVLFEEFFRCMTSYAFFFLSLSIIEIIFLILIKSILINANKIQECIIVIHAIKLINLEN